jgi:hypothetical protein
MIIGEGEHKYKWIENWGNIANTQSAGYSGKTHGIAVTRDNNVVIFRQSNPAILVFDIDGNYQFGWGNRFAGAHGLTLVEEENGAEFLWLTDHLSGEVVKTTLKGEKILNLEKPPLEIYQKGNYAPTWVAVNETRFSGNGDVWVADGYGESLVHRYNRKGKYLMTIDGTTGAGRFNCPHGIWFDSRQLKPQLLIADRSNFRVQIFDDKGNYQRTIGEDFLHSPCSFARNGKNLLIPELKTRLTYLSPNEQVEIYLGENKDVQFQNDYPNNRELLEKGKFHAPHAVAVDRAGNIYIVEWIEGGRIIKLDKSLE